MPSLKRGPLNIPSQSHGGGLCNEANIDIYLVRTRERILKKVLQLFGQKTIYNESLIERGIHHVPLKFCYLCKKSNLILLGWKPSRPELGCKPQGSSIKWCWIKHISAVSKSSACLRGSRTDWVILKAAETLR